MNDYPMDAAPQSLSELLQQSRKLTNHLGRSDLPQIQLGLDQIEKQSRKLVSKNLRAGSAQPNDARAHYFLANGGIDAAQLADTIQSANIAGTFEPLQPMYDTDVESYLTHEHQQVVISAIEQGRSETLQDFQRNLDRTMHRDWQRQKRKIFEELGQHQPSSGRDTDDVSRSGFGASTSAHTLPTSSVNSQLHGKMARYEMVVSRLNSSRLDGYKLALAHAFIDALSNLGQDAKNKELQESWKAIAAMVGEEDVRNGEFTATPINERQHAGAYIDLQRWNGANGVELRKALRRGAQTYLEKEFEQHMEHVIAANPVIAQRGGAPTVRSTVSAFLRVQHLNSQNQWRSDLAKELDATHNVPVWAEIYFLLRMGRPVEALECATENENRLRSTDPSVVAYLKAWLDSSDRRLPRLLKDRFVAEYNSRFRTIPEVHDPYKLGVYKLLGRIDVSKKFPALLTSSIQNWLWLQLSMVRETYDQKADAQDSVRDRFTLADLGNKVEKFGETYFDPKGQRPLFYFRLLILCGQFEKAVGFLFSRAAFQVDAIHFAILLCYYGLLRIPSQSVSSQVEYLSMNGGVASIDFAKLIQRYVRQFSQSSRRDALQYLYLICLNADVADPVGTEQVGRCHDMIRALVLEAHPTEFQELLGDVRANGAKTPGLIERSLPLIKIKNEREFLSTIVQVAATQCDMAHRTESAILLHNLAGQHDTVVAVLNKELGARLTEPSSATEWKSAELSSGASFSAASNLVTLATAILDAYEKQFGYSGKNRDTCRRLLELKKAVGLHSDGQHLQALQAIEALRILPLDAESRKDVVAITKKADEFKEVDENIARNFSEIVLMTMTILYKLHQELKESIHRNGSGAMDEYRTQARALMMWAGMLRFRMSSETYSQLTRLDVFVS